MKTEIEVKFLHIDIALLRTKLSGLQAEQVMPMRLMRRAILDFPDRSLQHTKNGFVRVRDEGDKVTVTYKQFNALSVDGAQEVEISVDSFEGAVDLMQRTGLTVHSMQESKRETWKLAEAEVVIDEWPWLEPYIEIEAASEAILKDIAGQLGFDWSQAVFGDVMAAYRAQYPHLSETDTVGTLSELRFDRPQPPFFKASK